MSTLTVRPRDQSLTEGKEVETSLYLTLPLLMQNYLTAVSTANKGRKQLKDT